MISGMNLYVKYRFFDGNHTINYMSFSQKVDFCQISLLDRENFIRLFIKTAIDITIVEQSIA